MASEWPTVRLGDLIEVRHGWPFKSALFHLELTGGPIVVSIGNFNYAGGFRFDSTAIKEYRGPYPREFELAPRDTLVVMTCQTPGGEILGIPARVPDDGRVYLHNQRMGRVVVKDPSRVSEDFLYWAFLSPDFNRHLVQTASGTKILHTAPGRIEAFEMSLPPLAEQRRIAPILGTLDDKIELNRRTTETLEAIARALFKSWFVDFDPVRAKSEGRDPGLPPHLADLFPDSFEDSELGEIPNGWRVMTIADLADVNARTLDRTDRLDVIDYVEISEVTRGQVANVVRYKRGTEPSRARRRLVHGDTIISTVRPDRGSYFLSLSPPETLIVSTGFAVASPRDGNWAFLYSALTRPEVGDELGRLADGGAYPAVRPEAVAGFCLVSPQVGETRIAYEELARPLYERSAHNRIENRLLASLRDTLLPKLISGEVRADAARGTTLP